MVVLINRTKKMMMMKRTHIIFAALLMLVCNIVSAQSWTTYQADVDPTAFDPAFSESNGAGTFAYTTLSDPDDAGNNLLSIKTDASAEKDNIQLRQYTNEDAVTVVLKARTVDSDNKGLLFDMDFRSATSTRFAIKVLNDGTYDIDKGGDGVVEDKGDWGFTATEWNTFRFTKSGADVNVYINEATTPVFTLSAVGDADGSGYWRFGDGWSSENVDTQYDWVTWDYTGAYSPDDQSLPSELVESEGNWTTYQADVDPTAFDPAFSESNGAGTFAYTTLSDPDDAGNNLLSIKTDASAEKDNIQLRQYTNEDAVTVVLKARTVDSDNKGLLFDMDFRSATSTRFAIKVLNDGTYDIDKGGDGVVEDKGDWGFTATEWNTFRFTKSGADVNVYINEATTPVFTLSAVGDADGSGYWRFGDGWSSENVDTQYDWVTWDYTGAYSPEDQSLPAELLADVTPIGDWTTYNADIDPTTFDPAFSESNGAGTFAYSIIEDSFLPDNNLLSIKTDASAEKDNIQLRQYTDQDAVTVVLKARTVDADNKGLLFDMDFRSANSTRFAIKVLNDGTYDIDKGGDGVVEDKGDWGFTATDWNIFRFTKSGADVNVYINEDPTPVFTLSAVGDADGSGYWRFGDGWSSENVDTQYDWVTWDYSGAYSPEQTRLPDNLVKPPLGDWTVYNADINPTEFDPAFSESNGAGTFAYSTLADPDDASNNLLSVKTDASAEKDNIQLRQYTDQDAVTVVLKARTVDADNKGLLFDMDFRSTTSTRFAIKVLNDGTYDIDKGGDGVVEDKGDWGFTATEWNTFRFTKDGANVNVFLNEASTPVFTLSAVGDADGSGYWRFGDGWSSENVDTQYDWVTWDYTGAYSPDQTRLPSALSGGDSGAEPVLNTRGSIDALSQDVGYAPDFSVDSYTISGADLTSDITVTPPANFEVSLNQTDWFTSANPLTITQTNGTVSDTSVYIKLNASAVGEYAGDITNSSDGAEEEIIAVSGTAVDLVPEITTTGTLEGFAQNLSTPSASQNYRVSGVNLKQAITVTAPTDFEVSIDETNWANSISIDATDRSITNAQVFVRLAASVLGDYSGTITNTSADASEVTIAVSGVVIPDPGINISGELADFTQSVGTPSESQTYTISGSNLAAGISILPPDGYEISFSEDVWLESLTLNPLEGDVEEITLFVRLNGSEEGTYNGNLVHSSTGVESVSLSLSGTVEEGLLLRSDDVTELFNMYPNPSSDRLSISGYTISSINELAIYTLEGSRVDTYKVINIDGNVELDITSLAKGAYLLKLNNGSERVSHKFIKQ